MGCIIASIQFSTSNFNAFKFTSFICSILLLDLWLSECFLLAWGNTPQQSTSNTIQSYIAGKICLIISFEIIYIKFKKLGKLWRMNWNFGLVNMFYIRPLALSVFMFCFIIGIIRITLSVTFSCPLSKCFPQLLFSRHLKLLDAWFLALDNAIFQVGDASGIQSPVSFGGFGSITRNLNRLASGIT